MRVLVEISGSSRSLVAIRSKVCKDKKERSSKSNKSSGESLFNTRESGDGNFNLNSTTRDKKDEVQEVRRSRPTGKDQAKRKAKSETSSAGSTNAFDVESLAKLMPTQCNGERPLQCSKGPGSNGVIADQKAGAETQNYRARNPSSEKSSKRRNVIFVDYL
ncbi:hypothetical protein Tco_1055571 [Tanacetum coccineum]|uniref:Uncharacterized protein n=1 Tax=Tanacetum coccineum TaxID=301880 RepID=A0ABQ5H0X8_9ASTR